MNYRNPEIQDAYDRFKRSYRGICAFCDVEQRNPDQIIHEYNTMLVILNEYPYAMWDNFEVGRHLMIIPVKHHGSFNDFSKDERDDFFELLRRFENDHYSVYSRAPSNKGRTVGHLHTHLIRPTGY